MNMEQFTKTFGDFPSIPSMVKPILRFIPRRVRIPAIHFNLEKQHKASSSGSLGGTKQYRIYWDYIGKICEHILELLWDYYWNLLGFTGSIMGKYVIKHIGKSWNLMG